MNFEPLLEELSEQLGVTRGALQPETALETFDTWDSLTKVTLIGVLHDRYQCAVDAEVLDRVRTVAELLDAVRRAVAVAEPSAA